ncbi:hypothetical protein [Novosphingobium sp. FKTRR1]|uniref:hypothetical protein n=1 Tax=Novosphingobium sp. FKTRR1 TaxID=2879118 RepID=UPI001CF00BC4|nr:hypothetical protein [Novosphingobium sp. FKTRR1]
MGGPKPCLGYRSRSEAVAALQAQGLSIRQIADRIGVRPSIVTALGGQRQRPARKLSDDQIADILERRERGWGYTQLADRHGVTAGAIHYQCLKHGAVSPRQRALPVPIAPAVRIGKDGTVQRVFTAADDARLLELEAQGLSYNAIARTMGRAYTSVRVRLMTLALREEIGA